MAEPSSTEQTVGERPEGESAEVEAFCEEGPRQVDAFLVDRLKVPFTRDAKGRIAHTAEAVEIAPPEEAPLPPKDWAVDGSLGGTGRSRNVNPIGMEKGSKGIDLRRSVKGPGFWRLCGIERQGADRTEALLDVRPGACRRTAIAGSMG